MSSPSLRALPLFAGAPSSAPAISFGLDSRGAILVPAIVMGALLTGMLFYVAAAGDAIIFRTQLQDAADTTAFTSAVWHAKGMNIIAVINILMALLLCVIVLFHVLEVICLVVALIPGVGSISMTVFRTLVQLEEKVSNGIGTGLHVLKITQQGVTVVVPYIAAFDAKRTPTAADTVWPGSMALLPVPVDKVFGQDKTRSPEKGPAALPVQDADFGTLCARATKVIPEQIMELIDKFADKAPFFLKGLLESGLKSIWGAIEGPIDTLAEAGDGLMCQPVNEIIAALAEKVAGTVEKGVSDKACGQEADDKAEDDRKKAEAANAIPNPDGTHKPPLKPASEAEKKNAKKQRDKQVGGCGSEVAAAISKSTNITVPPAAVWSAAANGNVFMHVWSRVSGTPHMFNRDSQFVAMADRGRMPTVTPSNVAVAEAEFYVDCSDAWSACSDDAMWAPNWTARMRRFRWPTEELAKMGKETVLNGGSVLEDVVFEQGEQFLADMIGKKAGGYAGEAIASFIITQVRKWDYFDKLVEKANEAIKDGAEAAGLGDLLEMRNPDEKRIH
jgi:hypothetical protein